MKKTIISLLILMISSQFTFAQKSGTTWPMNGKIRIYFTYPVNTSVSSSPSNNAVYINSNLDTVIVGYINRAKKSLDFCVYNTSSDAVTTPIITAVNNAYTQRSVTVRWIYDGSQTNSALSSLNSGIKKVASPVTTGYIMHDKFLIIDANSTTATDAYVLTGSPDWSTPQFNSCYNNIVILQDQALAQAYTSQFNQMWGSTTSTPGSGKFGTSKTASTTTTFTIGGSTVNLYFSPKDGTETQIINAINSATTDLYFGIYTFTTNNLANPIVTKHTAGVYTAGIMDTFSDGCSACAAYTTLSASSALGKNHLKIYDDPDVYHIYHNKMAIIDPSNPTSDPQVVTGSHNWSSAANTSNDENTLIIHNAAVANMYYQSFYQNFTDCHGTLQSFVGINNNIAPTDADVYIYPNPAVEGSPVYLNVNPSINLTNAKLVIFDVLGNKVKEIINLTAQQNAIDCGIKINGMYFYQLFNNGKPVKTGKFLFQ